MNTETANNLSETARIELANFHIKNGNAICYMIRGIEHVRVELPTGEVFVITI